MWTKSRCTNRVSVERKEFVRNECERDFRRPVPAVEEEREQAEFEIDVKFLRERQRRMLDEEDFIQSNLCFFSVQGNSID